jgi:AraC-like DNA-binding protein
MIQKPAQHHDLGFPRLLRASIPTEAEIDYPLHVRLLERGNPTPIDMDAHQGLEVNLVLEGRFERFLEDMVVVANPGDVTLVGPWEPHAWRVVAPGTTAIAVIFLAEVVEEGLADVPWLRMFTVPSVSRPRVATAALREKVLAIGWERLAERKAQRPGWLVAERLNLLRLLFTLHREWTPPGPLPADRHARAAFFERLRPAVDLVHANPLRHITQEQAATACGLRPSRFGRLFKDTVGMTFSDFRLRLRIAVVAHRLLATNKSIETIAEETGFADGSHLHHAFMKHYGCTPGQFREMRR